MKTAFLAAALLLLLSSGPACADYEETERRLKAVGIDDRMRERIHQAIDHAVAHLLERQGPRGSFMPQYSGERQYRVGVTALCGLALRHAGTPVAREGAKRAIRCLVGPGGKGRKEILGRTYTGGIAAMLFMAEGEPRDVGRTIARRIGESQRLHSGWWGYRITDRKTSQATVTRDLSNLSTTQFAALGLWAGARLGEPIPSKVWRRHLDGLLRTQLANGSWNYLPTRRYARTSETGSFMGAANLLLAESALKEFLHRAPALNKQVLAARLKALNALKRDGRQALERLADVKSTSDEKLAWAPSYYALYALEKACIFAGLEKLGDVPWYRTGAESLLRLQRKDGGWGGDGLQGEGRAARRRRKSRLISTAFALLFLLRSSEVYRPVLPATVDSDRPKPPVVTPGK